MNGIREVEIADIERELTRLWREASPQAFAAGTEAPGVLRACALNLVVAGCGAEQQGLAQILLEVTERYPCRAVLLSVEEGDLRPPRGWVSLVCHAGGRGQGQPQVCCEQIVLVGPASARHEMAASVSGLLAPDLPTFLWWRGRLPATAIEKERFDHLAHIADRVLLDSADYDAAQLAAVARLFGELQGRSFGDLNWARLTLWRAAVAQCFDSPANRALLPALEAVRIFHPGAAPGAALRLMGGWLRSRLRPSPPVEFVEGATEIAELRASSACFRIARPAVPGEAASLCEELRLVGRDGAFEQALEAALEELSGAHSGA